MPKTKVSEVIKPWYVLYGRQKRRFGGESQRSFFPVPVSKAFPAAAQSTFSWTRVDFGRPVGYPGMAESSDFAIKIRSAFPGALILVSVVPAGASWWRGAGVRGGRLGRGIPFQEIPGAD